VRVGNRIRQACAVGTHDVEIEFSQASTIGDAIHFEYLPELSCPRFVSEDFDVELQARGIRPRSDRERMPMLVDLA
jgi:hypothetical protein